MTPWATLTVLGIVAGYVLGCWATMMVVTEIMPWDADEDG